VVRPAEAAEASKKCRGVVQTSHVEAPAPFPPLPFPSPSALYSLPFLFPSPSLPLLSLPLFLPSLPLSSFPFPSP